MALWALQDKCNTVLLYLPFHSKQKISTSWWCSRQSQGITKLSRLYLLHGDMNIWTQFHPIHLVIVEILSESHAGRVANDFHMNDVMYLFFFSLWVFSFELILSSSSSIPPRCFTSPWRGKRCSSIPGDGDTLLGLQFISEITDGETRHISMDIIEGPPYSGSAWLLHHHTAALGHNFQTFSLERSRSWAPATIVLVQKIYWQRDTVLLQLWSFPAVLKRVK